jgi:hypothetical protein
MDIEKGELMKNLANDFSKAVKNYRLARQENEVIKPNFSSWEEDKEEEFCQKEKLRINSINTSKDYINLTRLEYWEFTLKSKIEVIGAIGGFEFMQEFSRYLREIDYISDDDSLLLESAFSWYADGICGWCR